MKSTIARELLTLGQTLESVAEIVKLPVEEIRQLLSQDEKCYELHAECRTVSLFFWRRPGTFTVDKSR